MYIIVWLILGGIAGWIASILTHNNRRMGIVLNIFVGLVGAAIGSAISQLAGLGGITIFSFWGMVFAVIGAVMLLSLINLLWRRR